MKGEYLYKTFSSETTSFDQRFTGYLNGKRADRWRVMECSFCHDEDHKKMWASCIFERNT
jgi:hypothetical protein